MKKVRDLEDEANALSPLQASLAERTGEWTKRATALLRSLPDHVAALERVRGRAPAPGPPWKFADGALDWQHQVLEDLVGRLQRLGDPAGPIPARMERLRRFEETVKDARWGPTEKRVAENPRYGGLRLVPQVGLVPLGPDPDSGLEEFAHVASGSVATRDPATNRLAYADDAAIVLVLVPGGKFLMGAQNENPAKPNHDTEALDADAPVHEVTLSAFFLAKHECTQAQWKALAGGAVPSRFQEGAEAPRRALEQVSWDDSKRWLPETGLALPTEAQWERACRAGSTTRFCFGDDARTLATCAWYRENSDGAVRPVGQLKPNVWGLHDMHGNVWEWCEDGYAGYASPSSGPIRDPVGHNGTGVRVVRGGSWYFPARSMQSALRDANAPGNRNANLGFRPARAVTAN